MPPDPGPHTSRQPAPQSLQRRRAHRHDTALAALALHMGVAGFQVEGLPTLEWTAIAVDAPAPPFSQHSDSPVVGDTIALAVRDTVTGPRVFCAPGLVQIGALEFDPTDATNNTLVAGHGRWHPPWIAR